MLLNLTFCRERTAAAAVGFGMNEEKKS